MPNIQGPLPAVVLDVAACKENLGVRTELDELSADSFCLRWPDPIKVDEKLLVITQISQAILMLRGEVSRIQKLQTGGYRLSVSITQHQIFSSLAGDPSIERFRVHDSKDSAFREVSMDYGPSS